MIIRDPISRNAGEFGDLGLKNQLVYRVDRWVRFPPYPSGYAKGRRRWLPSSMEV